MTYLLSASERSKSAVLKSLHLIRVDSIFSGKYSFDLFLDCLYDVISFRNKEDLENVRTLESQAIGNPQLLLQAMR